MTDSVSAPRPVDFEAAFGCECSIDEDLVQKCTFLDSAGQKIIITFGLIDETFGLSVFRDELEVVRIYDEFLSSVTIDEKFDLVIVELRGGARSTFEICVWPIFKLSSVSMKP